MNTSDWTTKYGEINNTFKRTLVFRVGIESGFFSEINHLFMAVLYCLQNKIKFVMHSQKNNFSYNKGWDDYFLPFCEENYVRYHLIYNVRNRPTKIADLLRNKIFKKVSGIQYLTQDIWPFIKDAKFHNEQFNIPELEINGDFLQAMFTICRNLWVYKPEVASEITARIQRLNMPEHFVAIHIRSGDIEKKKYDIKSYLNLLKLHSNNKTLFVATDDYQSIKDVKKNFDDYKLYTFCEQKEKGFDEGVYNSMKAENKKETVMALLTDTELLYRSEVFVGTMSSNVGTFVGMRRKAKSWYGIDANDWRIA